MGLAAGRNRFFCRELDAVALATNVTVFMERGTILALRDLIDV